MSSGTVVEGGRNGRKENGSEGVRGSDKKQFIPTRKAAVCGGGSSGWQRSRIGTPAVLERLCGPSPPPPFQAIRCMGVQRMGSDSSTIQEQFSSHTHTLSLSLSRSRGVLATPVHMDRRPHLGCPPAGPNTELMVCSSGRM